MWSSVSFCFISLDLCLFLSIALTTCMLFPTSVHRLFAVFFSILLQVKDPLPNKYYFLLLHPFVLECGPFLSCFKLSSQTPILMLFLRLRLFSLCFIWAAIYNLEYRESSIECVLLPFLYCISFSLHPSLVFDENGFCSFSNVTLTDYAFGNSIEWIIISDSTVFLHYILLVRMAYYTHCR